MFLSYDFREKGICAECTRFLKNHCFVKIPMLDPIVRQEKDLFEFMVLRRKVHKMFNMISCNEWVDLLERNAFASEKNLILQETIISLV